MPEELQRTHTRTTDFGAFRCGDVYSRSTSTLNWLGSLLNSTCRVARLAQIWFCCCSSAAVWPVRTSILLPRCMCAWERASARTYLYNAEREADERTSSAPQILHWCPMHNTDTRRRSKAPLIWIIFMPAHYYYTEKSYGAGGEFNNIPLRLPPSHSMQMPGRCFGQCSERVLHVEGDGQSTEEHTHCKQGEPPVKHMLDENGALFIFPKGG